MLPARSLVVCPVLSKQSASKCVEHKTSFFFGVQPSRLTARSHALRNSTSLGNLKSTKMFHSVSMAPGRKWEMLVRANASVIAKICVGKRASEARYLHVKSYPRCLLHAIRAAKCCARAHHRLQKRSQSSPTAASFD